jgi:hypothetical protein
MKWWWMVVKWCVCVFFNSNKNHTKYNTCIDYNNILEIVPHMGHACGWGTSLNTTPLLNKIWKKYLIITFNYYSWKNIIKTIWTENINKRKKKKKIKNMQEYTKNEIWIKKYELHIAWYKNAREDTNQELNLKKS